MLQVEGKQESEKKANVNGPEKTTQTILHPRYDWENIPYFSPCFPTPHRPQDFTEVRGGTQIPP